MPGMRSLAFLLLVALATPAGAAELYRCTVKGRTVYQDAPCKDGRKIDTDEREAIRGYGATRPDAAGTTAATPAPTQPAAPAGAVPVPAAPVPAATPPAPAPQPAPPPAPTNRPQAAPRNAPPGAGNTASDECPALAAKARSLREQLKASGATDANTRLNRTLNDTEERMRKLKCA